MIRLETFDFGSGRTYSDYLFLALAVFRMKGYVAGFITVVLTVLVALFAYKMPFKMAMAATGYGFCTGYGQLLGLSLCRYFYIKFL